MHIYYRWLEKLPSRFMLDFHYFFVGGLRFNENTYKLKLPAVKQSVGVQFFGKTSLLERVLDFCLDSVGFCLVGCMAILKRANKFFVKRSLRYWIPENMYLGGGFKYVFWFSPQNLGGTDPIWLAHIFQMGGKKTHFFECFQGRIGNHYPPWN